MQDMLKVMRHFPGKGCYNISPVLLPVILRLLTLIRWGGGRSAPPLEKPYISLEPKVGLTSNQAVNLSLWFVLRPI